MGALGWTPDTFWNATIYDFRRAVAGFKKANGIKDNPKREMTRREMEELRDFAREERANDLRRQRKHGN